MSRNKERTALDMLNLLEDFATGKGLWEGVQRIKNFDMRVWEGYNTECGKVACLAGHMCRDIIWNNMGLEFSNELYAPVPSYQGNMFYTALSKLLKITESDACCIFNPDNYYYYYYYYNYNKGTITIEQVIERIKQVRGNYESQN